MHLIRIFPVCIIRGSVLENLSAYIINLFLIIIPVYSEMNKFIKKKNPNSLVKNEELGREENVSESGIDWYNLVWHLIKR